MGLNLEYYDSDYRIVSIALDEEILEDLNNDQLSCLYVTNTEIVLYPDKRIVSVSPVMIKKLQNGDNYDVYGVLPNGHMIQWFDNKSNDNFFFVSGKCNSNCIMCPSPEVVRRNGENSTLQELIDIAMRIPSNVSHLTITGGEPFMMGEDIFDFLEFLKEKFEETEFLLLTNGRLFCIEKYAVLLKKVLPYNSILGIPIHGSCSSLHDAITQSAGSFRQTMQGLKILLKLGVRVELRLVPTKLNLKDFNRIIELIINEIPNNEYVCIMAPEMTGNAAVNKDLVWISYSEIAMEVQKGVIRLIHAGIDCKLYNFPLCLLKPELWTLCSKSISTNKVKYSRVCNECKVQSSCGGVFSGTYKLVEPELKAVL